MVSSSSSSYLWMVGTIAVNGMDFTASYEAVREDSRFDDISLTSDQFKELVYDPFFNHLLDQGQVIDASINGPVCYPGEHSPEIKF